MLLGWLFGGSVMAGGHLQSAWRKSSAKTDGKKTYIDSSGIERYVDTNLPYNNDYEKLKKHSNIFYKSIEDDWYIKKCKQGIEEAKKGERPEDYMIKYYEKAIEKRIEKINSHNDKYANDPLNDLTKQRLRKQGYKF